MASVRWSLPGTSGNWGDETNWAGLPLAESYPGDDALRADAVTIQANTSYIVTFNVLSASIGSLEIDGGAGAQNSTTLEMQGDNTLTIQGSLTFLLDESDAVIDGSGTINLLGGQIETQVNSNFTGVTPTSGTFMAGTDTTGGTLDLAGTGSISGSIVFAIGTAAPSTLRFDLASTVVTTDAISIDNVNQTLEIGSMNTLAIGATQNVTDGTILMAGGTLRDTSGISFGTTSSSGSLSGFGTVVGTLTRSGTGTANTITATGGNLTLSTAIGSNSGLIFAIGRTAASALQLNADPGNGNAFTFLGSAGELALTSSAASGFNDSIVGLDVASTLTPTNLVDILGDTTVTVTSGQIGFGTTGTVRLSDGAVLNLSGITDASGPWFVNTTPDGGGTGTEIFLSSVCYARGTVIQTPAGERPVETLRPGMQVITLVDDNEIPRTVKWVGHRRIDLTRHPRPETVAPIRIQRHAFADNMPHTDLLLSPDHAVFVDGKLICARQLLNGTTIRQETGLASVEYLHVELDAHAILLAEGLPAESYLDTGNRGFFANGTAPLMLHPDLTDERDYPTREAGSCVPFVFDDADVEPVWRRLAERAGTLGHVWIAPATTADPGLHLLADGRSIWPMTVDGQRYEFVLPAVLREPGSVRLISRSGAPSDLRQYPADRRRLGVAVSRIIVRSRDEQSEIRPDQSAFSRGWHEVERDGDSLWRWTNGDAVLPLLGVTGPVVLEVQLVGTIPYVVDAVSAGGTGRLSAA